jgi:hypothetical protein
MDLDPDPDPGELKLAGRPAKNGGRPWFDGTNKAFGEMGQLSSINATTMPSFLTKSWSVRIRNTSYC